MFDPLSWILKILPVVGDVVPILILTRFPVNAGAPVGDQSIESSLPLVKLVDVELMVKAFPVVNELASKVTAAVLVVVDATWNGDAGVEVPIPTFPLIMSP